MPVFEYKALDGKGKNVTGIVDADSAVAARQKLRSSGIFTVSIREVRAAAATRRKGRWDGILRPFARIKPAELALMTRQLATLLGAGFPLVSALDAILTQTKAPVLKKIMARVKDAVVEGNSFAAALSQYPETFSPLYVNMVKAGESSGTLEIVLERLADTTEKQLALNTRIKNALTYPMLMMLIGSGVLFFLLTVIVPSITQIFTEVNQQLPTPTRILIGLSDILKASWWILVLLIAGGAVALRRLARTTRGRHLLDTLKLRLPGFGLLARKLAVARFARTLGSLLENGVNLLTALDIVKNVVGNTLIARTIEEASDEVGRGQALGKALSGSDHFPSLAIQMVQVGEQSGELEKMLTKVAGVYEGEVESTVMRLTTLLEPVMILVMGVVVGMIVLSILLPIFEMNQLVM